MKIKIFSRVNTHKKISSQSSFPNIKYIRKAITGLALLGASFISHADSIGNQGGFFSNNISGSSEVVRATGNATVLLQQAIDRASQKQGGGVVILRGDDITLGQIEMKSNVRLEIQSGATLKMASRVLFNLGRNGLGPRNPRLRNVEITSTGQGRFTIDVNKSQIFQNAIPVRVGYVRNFALSNFNIDDNYTIFPSVFMVADSDDRRVPNNLTYSRVPEKGVVQNITATNVATGYALIQLFSGKRMLLRDLDATGGLTIRLEPGSGRPSDFLNQAGPRVGNIEDIRMENIHNREGMAAIFLKPHEKICTGIFGRNITATDSAFAILTNSSDSNSFTRGTFEQIAFSSPIRLTQTNDLPLADIGASSQYFVVPSERIGRTRIADFPRDPSGRRWHTKPIAPVLLASSLNANDAGPREKGRFNITINGVPTTRGNLESNTKILYRENAIRLNGSEATQWIER